MKGQSQNILLRILVAVQNSLIKNSDLTFGSFTFQKENTQWRIKKFSNIHETFIFSG